MVLFSLGSFSVWWPVQLPCPPPPETTSEKSFLLKRLCQAPSELILFRASDSRRFPVPHNAKLFSPESDSNLRVLRPFHAGPDCGFRIFFPSLVPGSLRILFSAPLSRNVDLWDTFVGFPCCLRFGQILPPFLDAEDVLFFS